MTETALSAPPRGSAAMQAAVFASFALAVWNHLLPAFDYALTHLFFDYSEGFVRRGLTGAVLARIWPEPVPRDALFLAAFLITFTGAVSILWYLSRTLRHSLAGQLLLVVALNSFAFASFLGFSAYLDGVLVLVAVLALATPATGAPGLVARSLLICAGALVHEIMVPFFACLIAFDCWMAETGPRRWRALWPLGVGLAVALALFGWGELPPEALARISDRIADRMPIPPRADAIAVLGQSLQAHGAGLTDFRAQPFYKLSVLFDGLPLAAMSLWLLWLGLRLLPDEDALTRLGLAAAVLAPLSVNAVAFDIARFGVASVLCGFFAVAIILARRTGAAQRLGAHFGIGHAVLVLVLNANVFTMSVAQGTGHTAQAPWVTIKQLVWFGGAE